MIHLIYIAQAASDTHDMDLPLWPNIYLSVESLMFPGEIFRGFHLFLLWLFLRFTSALSYGSNSLIGLFISARPLSSPLINILVFFWTVPHAVFDAGKRRTSATEPWLDASLSSLLYAMVAFMGRLFCFRRWKWPCWYASCLFRSCYLEKQRIDVKDKAPSPVLLSQT